MRFFTIASVFAAAVSAIDIRLQSGSNCGGAWAACVGLNPNVCCSNGAINYVSINAIAIPTNWRVELRAYQGGGCSGLRNIRSSGGATSVCISEGDGFARLTGGGWNQATKKRNAGVAACSATTCTSSVKPNLLVLDDQTTAFDIADMEESEMNVLTDLAFNGTQAADIPQAYEAYKISI